MKKQLKLVSYTKKQRETCNGCVFNKSKTECLDEGFIISQPAGFVGGCDNPKQVSGIFIYENGDKQ